MRNWPVEHLAWTVVWLILLIPWFPTRGQDLAQFEKRLTEFRLENGMEFLVLERPQVPVVSFHTHVNVGSADEVKGITGLAHLLEHLAFKGTRTLGTRDYDAEAELMAEMDMISQAIQAERRKGDNADTLRLAQLRTEFTEAQQKAQALVRPDEFGEVFKQAGCVSFNAHTDYDSTVYTVSLPSNKLELWMLMESDRFLNPVFREFYTERDVVMEERRQLVESSPIGRLGEEFLSAAYKAHPYGEPAVGHMSDLETITRAEAQAFFQSHYSTANLTVAVVGDVDPTRVKELATAYFGRLPYHPPPTPVTTEEPPQPGERRVVVEDRAQPVVMIGYHKPSIKHPDNAVFDAIVHITGGGRTSRIHRTLVEEMRIAINVTSFHRVPGCKYPGLFVIYAMPAKEHTTEECEAAIYREMERLQEEPVTAEELEKAKTRATADLVSRLVPNDGLAAELAFYEVVTGDWRNLFRRPNQIGKVTADDIQRVARTYFKPVNRTVGVLKTVSTKKGS